MRGVCVEPRAGPTPRRLKTLGVDGVRIVAFDDPVVYAYAASLHKAGLSVAVVYARESFSTDDYTAEARDYAFSLEPDLHILGNEMDAGLLGVPSPSSWSMSPDDYGDMFARCASGIQFAQPDAKLCLGGFVGGQPSAVGDYLAAVRARYSGRIAGFDLHPYTLDAANAAACISAYAAYMEPTMQVYVMEWNRSPRELAAYVAMLDAETAGWCFFRWQAGGDAPGMSLIDGRGHANRSYTALRKALR